MTGACRLISLEQRRSAALDDSRPAPPRTSRSERSFTTARIARRAYTPRQHHRRRPAHACSGSPPTGELRIGCGTLPMGADRYAGHDRQDPGLHPAQRGFGGNRAPICAGQDQRYRHASPAPNGATCAQRYLPPTTPEATDRSGSAALNTTPAGRASPADQAGRHHVEAWLLAGPPRVIRTTPACRRRGSQHLGDYVHRGIWWILRP